MMQPPPYRYQAIDDPREHYLNLLQMSPKSFAKMRGNFSHYVDQSKEMRQLTSSFDPSTYPQAEQVKYCKRLD